MCIVGLNVQNITLISLSFNKHSDATIKKAEVVTRHVTVTRMHGIHKDVREDPETQETLTGVADDYALGKQGVTAINQALKHATNTHDDAKKFGMHQQCSATVFPGQKNIVVMIYATQCH